MRLKKLVLVGFKSFAEKTTLHFDAGITCIVGPNGCGKSNISDAFRWVLGEQSAKSLRGGKMPDVIFAGASNRKPLNFAEVSLTLSDIQGALPIDYEEVTITRRLHRSGESEYFINSNPVRLKDIHTLLFDSGIGRNSFSIFEQGKLDQVINYSPNERRYIFEEAAGIVRFLHRKQEAFKRLEQAELNLSRVNDIHLEVEKNISVLKGQAEKALVFKESQSKFELLDKSCFVLRWQNWEKKRGDTENQQSTNQSRLKESHASLVAKYEKVKEIKLAVQQNEKNWKEQNEAVFKLRSAVEIQKNEQQSNELRLQEIEQKSKRLKRELEDLNLSKKTRREAYKEIEARRKKIEEEFEEAASKLTLQTEKVKQKEKEVSQIRHDLQIKQQEHFKWIQRESALSSEIKQIEVRLENNEDRGAHLNEKLKLLIEDQKHASEQILDKREQLQDASELVDAHKERLEQFEEDLQQVVVEMDRKSKEIEALRRRGIEQKARQNVLIRMREEMEGFSSGSKRLIQESQDKKSLLHGLLTPLYEFLKPDPAFAEALSAVLKGYGQTLVVETEKQLKKVIEFAEQEAIQDYSLVCLEYIQPNKSKKQSTLSDHVERHPLADHFLSHVKTLTAYDEILTFKASQTLGLEAWFEKGIFIDHRGVLFKIKANENQVFLREAELKNLQEELTRFDDQLKKLEQAAVQFEEKKAHLQLERAEVDKLLRRDEMKLVEVNFGLQRTLSDLEKLKLDHKTCEKEQKEVFQIIERQKTELKERQRAYHTVQQELSEIQEKRNLLEADLSKQEQGFRIQQQDEKEKGQAYQQLVEDKRRLTHQSHLLESKEQDHDNQVQRINDECEELAEHQEALQIATKTLVQSIQEMEKRLEAAVVHCLALENGGDQLKKTLEQAEREGHAQQEAANQIEMQLAQLNTQHEHILLAVQALIADLYEKYQLSIEDIKALEIPTDRSLDQIERQMRVLKQTLQEAGDVNLTAIEELEKQRVRYGFLTQQIEDMKQTKNELMQIIGQLDAESRRLLKETFEQVRRNFQKNFQILFNGGEADLQFIGSPDNILEAGIEISAKPPGKQMRSISLLSGGEKCLTAVALLFAIFEVKPAPFCILDEIDAPLDDTNVERFVNVVRHFVDRCQFLIITHNKRTMAIGDILFGVSMEEKGVSKLLSLEFSHEALPETSLV